MPDASDESLPMNAAADAYAVQRSDDHPTARGRGAEQSPPQPTLTMISGLAFGGLLLIVAAIVVLRSQASTIDFAMINAVTLGLGVLAWLVLTFGLWATRLPRVVWRLTLGVPIGLGCLFFAIFKVERVDGDLLPKFAWRWQAPDELPGVGSSAPAESSLFAARPTDFPQFLGPHRDGMLPTVNLATDWQDRPPTIAWKQPIGNGWSGFAVQGDVAITLEQREAQEWVTAYHVADGRLLWNYAMASRHTNPLGGTGPRSTPTIDADRVFACSAVSQIVCLKLSSGELIWNRELLDFPQQEFEASVTWGRSASPLVAGGRVFVPRGGRPGELDTLIALDAADGTLLWSGGEDQISYSSPLLATIAGTPQILYTSEKMLGAYDPSDGHLLWSVAAPSSSNADSNISQPVVFDDGRILITKGYGQGARLIEVKRNEEVKGSEVGQWSVNELWSTPQVLRTKFTSCVVLAGFAYGLSDGILECVDLSSGQRVWKQGRYRQGQILLAGAHLLVTSESGEVALVEATPQGFRELGRIQVIGDVSWNTAALSGERLLVRNSDEAACVILPLADEADLGKVAATVGRPVGVQLERIALLRESELNRP